MGISGGIEAVCGHGHYEEYGYRQQADHRSRPVGLAGRRAGVELMSGGGHRIGSGLPKLPTV
jgi:hypothetical protein